MENMIKITYMVDIVSLHVDSARMYIKNIMWHRINQLILWFWQLNFVKQNYFLKTQLKIIKWCCKFIIYSHTDNDQHCLVCQQVANFYERKHMMAIKHNKNFIGLAFLYLEDFTQKFECIWFKSFKYLKRQNFWIKPYYNI